MSDSDDSSVDCNDDTQGNKNGEKIAAEYVDRKSIPKRLRRRYWNSYEEMRLVELWRKHFQDIVALDKNLPIFRTISHGMRDKGFHINAQEVRRKLTAIKTKYITERRRLMECKDQSQWRLYPLVHNIFETKSSKPNADITYDEENALTSIIKETKENPLFDILMSGLPVIDTLEKIEAGESVYIPPPKKLEYSFPIENKTLAASIAFGYANANRLSFTPRSHRHDEISHTQAKIIAAAAHSMSFGNQKDLQLNVTSYPKSENSVSFLKRKITLPAIQQLRLENSCLAEKTVIERKRLKQEELQYKTYKAMLEEVNTFLKKLVSNTT